MLFGEVYEIALRSEHLPGAATIATRLYADDLEAGTRFVWNGDDLWLPGAYGDVLLGFAIPLALGTSRPPSCSLSPASLLVHASTDRECRLDIPEWRLLGVPLAREPLVMVARPLEVVVNLAGLVRQSDTP